MSARTVLAIALLLTAGGCGRGVDPPAAPPAVLEPRVSTHPPHRATRVALDTGIHATFDVALDPATLTATNLYLKVDDQRYPIAIEWDDATRRLTIVPGQNLLLGRTYTVELTARVRAMDGSTPFPHGWFWQFTTISIRPLRTPEPAHEATWVSPFMRLKWDATESSAGATVYQVFWSTDSAEVAERRAPAGTVSMARWIPAQRWGEAPIYWAVRATNLRTGDVLEGPTWRFQVVPSGAPTRTGVLRALSYGFASSTQPPRCNQVSTALDPNGLTAIRWELPPSDARLDHVEFFASIHPLVSVTLTLRATQRSWEGCAIAYPSTPTAVGPALAVSQGATGGQVLRSDALTAFVEAAARDRDLFGFVILPSRTATIVTNNPGDPFLGGMLIRTFDPPPPAPAGVAPR